MANRNRPPFKPTIATVAQLEEFQEQVKGVLQEWGTRLAITEHAVSQLIQDVYYSEDVEFKSDPDTPVSNDTIDERPGASGPEVELDAGDFVPPAGTDEYGSLD